MSNTEQPTLAKCDLCGKTAEHWRGKTGAPDYWRWAWLYEKQSEDYISETGVLCCNDCRYPEIASVRNDKTNFTSFLKKLFAHVRGRP